MLPARCRDTSVLRAFLQVDLAFHSCFLIDINEAAKKHNTIIPDILAAHGLTGYDTVMSYCGIGKAAAPKILRSGEHLLNVLARAAAHPSDVVEQATYFMQAYYGQYCMPNNVVFQSWKASTQNLC